MDKKKHAVVSKVVCLVIGMYLTWREGKALNQLEQK